MKGQAAHLQGMVEALARRRGLDATGICEVVPMPAKDDWRTLVRFAAGESAALSQRGISLDLNLSGGTKPMSMAFAEALQSQARRLYCATDAGELQFINTLDAPPTSLAPDLLDLPTYLAAQAWAIGTRVADGDANATAIEKFKDLTASLVLSHQALNDTFAQAERIEVGSAQPASPHRQLQFKP